MTASQSLNLYNLSLRYFKNEADAKAFVSEIELIVDNKFENKKDILATKADISNLELKIADLRTELKTEMKEQKSEMIKWMFIFWVGQIATIIALIYLKK